MTKRPTITARDIELAVVQHFGARLNIVVPNVSWGFLRGYEADLLVIRPSGYCDEVEIKVTRGDLRADLKNKYHWHDSQHVKRLWFALPEWLVPDARELLPEGTGILGVSPEIFLTNRSAFMRVRTHQSARARRATPLTAQEIANIARLGCMRIWTLKAECARWKRLYDDHKTAATPLDEMPREEAEATR